VLSQRHNKLTPQRRNAMGASTVEGDEQGGIRSLDRLL